MTTHPTFYKALDDVVGRHSGIYLVRENTLPSLQPNMKVENGKQDLLAMDGEWNVVGRERNYGVKGLLSVLTDLKARSAPIPSPPFVPWLANGYGIAFLRHGDLRSVRLVATTSERDSTRLPVFANTRGYEEPLIRVIDALQKRSPELLRIAANSLRAP